LHNQDLHNLYSSPNIIIVISLRTDLVGNVARMWEMSVYKFFSSKEYLKS